MQEIQLKAAKAGLSAVTVAEIADSIAKAKREGARRKAAGLTAWLRTVLHLYGDRVLPLDGPTAEIAGALSLPADRRPLPCTATLRHDRNSSMESTIGSHA